jgi:hypothetical protein
MFMSGLSFALQFQKRTLASIGKLANRETKP